MSDKFWAMVAVSSSDACWVWVGRRDKYGYGVFSVNGKQVGAHRVSWSLANGEIQDGMHILHRCNNPSCVNPSHLYAGTHRQNMDDMIAAGSKKGVKNGQAKLTDKDVVAIRKKCAAGSTMAEMSREYGMSFMAISNLVHMRSWKHVGEDA